MMSGGSSIKKGAVGKDTSLEELLRPGAGGSMCHLDTGDTGLLPQGLSKVPAMVSPLTTHWCLKSMKSGFARGKVPYLKNLDFFCHQDLTLKN